MWTPALLTFDCYGTLIDWHGGLRGALAGLGVPAADLDRLAGRYVPIEMAVEAEAFRPYREVMARTLERLLAEEGLRLPVSRRDLLAESLPGWDPFPDVPAALVRLSRLAPLAILSNIDDDLLEASVRRLGVPIAHRVTASQVRSYKPAATHFRRILEIARVEAPAVVHVAGSLLHDVRPARALGFRALWVRRTTEPIPPDVPADAVVPSLAAAADRLERAATV
jgi:2-haloalkanoic acid dehalogenase type II